VNEQKLKVSGDVYSVTIDGNEIVGIEEEKSYWDTASGELNESLREYGVTGHNFVHIPEENLYEALTEIGGYIPPTDLEITRIEDSTSVENGVYVEWEQESAKELHDNPRKDNDILSGDGVQFSRPE
jgi:hypothetical protein